MTRVRLIADDESAPLFHAILGAPWQEAAGIDIAIGIGNEQDAALVCATRSATGRVLEQAGAGPSLVVGPGAAGIANLSHLHDIRIRPRGLGMADDVVVRDRVADLSHLTGEVLATASIAYSDRPVARWNADDCTASLGVGVEPRTWFDREFLRLIHRLLHRISRPMERPTVRIGLLGYGAIGHEHAGAIGATDGLELGVVCDVSADRLLVAQDFTPGVATTTDPESLRASADVDAVIVSTPPNTHGRWAIDLLESGKHVVLEKPMALTSAECDVAMGVARANDRALVVYQNRRFDPDFRAISQAIADGDLGEVFHLEAFVGAYQHPCNYWHSDAEVSGGALFDWGSHIVDQILQLMPGDVEYVTARNHKRMWHDVTNADHARMTLHYADGREATFIYSDLAAALKPRWYLAGTEGGLIGDWRRERVIARSPIGTLAEDILAPADSSPDLWLHGSDGRVTALPGRPAPVGEFHRQFADLIREGLPMTVTAEQSRRVVAMLEAAERSAAIGGTPVRPE